jgi:hypothetical protein
VASRGANGKFTAKPAAPPAAAPADELPDLVDLTIEPIDMPEPPAGLPSPPPAAPIPDELSAEDARLAVELARGVDELVGLFVGAAYRATPDEVAAVGQAADPLMRRGLAFFHAAELAESSVPAPIRELVRLAVTVWLAWGDALVVTAQQQIAERRKGRTDGATNGSPGSADERGQGDGRPDRFPLDDPAQVAAGRDGAADVRPARPANGAPTAYELATRVDTGARPRRPGKG